MTNYKLALVFVAYVILLFALGLILGFIFAGNVFVFGGYLTAIGLLWLLVRLGIRLAR